MPRFLQKKQKWPWWFLLPLYPYGRRRTLIRELIPNQLWSFEQIQGLLYVAVPIRMTVTKISDGLMLYGPVAPTIEVIEALTSLEEKHGPVVTIVLPTASGLEHKVPLPSLSRAFPKAKIWICPGQWSFPLNLPLDWLGISAKRTKVLLEQGTPHGDQLAWYSLGPLDLGIGRFQEIGCFHQSSNSLLLIDSLISISLKPPDIFDLDPTPLLFHARDYGNEHLMDSKEKRTQGWARMVLFSSYLRPESVKVRPFGQTIFHSFRCGLRHPHTHYGLYPIAWQSNWYKAAELILATQTPKLQIAPVLERLVFPRAKNILLEWLEQLQRIENLGMIIPSHYSAPIPCCRESIIELKEGINSREWAINGKDWSFLASLDSNLLNLGALPKYSSF